MVQDVITNILTKLPATVEGKTSRERPAAESHDQRTLTNLLTDPAWEMLVRKAKGIQLML